MVEKIKVNLSYSVYNLLLHDMEDFKFDIKDDIPNKRSVERILFLIIR